MAMNVRLLLKSLTKTITNSDGTTKAAPEEWTGRDGAASVHIASSGGIGQNNDRQASAIGTTLAFFSWTAGFGPKSIRMRLKDGTSNDYIKFTFDAPNAAVAAAWIAEDGGAADPRMYRSLHNVDTADGNSVGEDGWTYYDLTGPLEFLHYNGIGTLGAGTLLEVEAN